MDKTQKLQYQKDVEKYLEEKKVYDIFEDLMKSLIVEQPTDPIDYLINKLNQPEQKRIFIVGPPGSKIREHALELSYNLREATNTEYTCLSVGDLLDKEISKKSELGQQIENSVKNFQYIKDEIVTDIVLKKIEEVSKQSDNQRNFVLEGFPKTRVQGLALQKNGIIPSTFIIYNVPDDDIEKHSLAKLRDTKAKYDSIVDKEKAAKNHAQEYKLHLSQVKEIYARNFFQVSSKEVNIPEEMAKIVKFKIDSKSPKRAARILIAGPPGSGRSTLAKNLAQKYGLVHVSTRQLIADQIARNTEVGKIALQLYSKGDLIKDEIITGLIHDRLEKIDCHIQGYVLDGYPKNGVQVLSLQDLKITPSLIIFLEATENKIKERLLSRKVDPLTGITYSPLNPTNDPEVQKRLQSGARDTEELIARRTLRWKELQKNIESQFDQQQHIILKVNSDQSVQNILEQVSIHLEKSV